MPAAKDITGNRYGRLVAVEWTGVSVKNHGRLWKCLCDCGNSTEVTVSQLEYGTTTSCGCAQRDATKTHGMSQSPEWKSWHGAKDRCLNPNNKDYSKYGGIGIEFFPDWKDNFSAFLEHVGLKPLDGKKYSLGRIDNTKGYLPGNVKWETAEEQARNRSIDPRNTTGVSGVVYQSSIVNGNFYEYFVATWTVSKRKQQSAYFSIAKHGREVAFQLAVDKRLCEVEKARENGVFLAESHGKRKGEKVND